MLKGKVRVSTEEIERYSIQKGDVFLPELLKHKKKLEKLLYY